MKPKILNATQLSREFNELLNRFDNSDTNFFITGRAGTGKSTLLKLYSKTSKKRVAVLAPTGIAALQIGGQTIHSFFRLPPKMIDPSEIRKSKNHRFYKKVDVIIIDEISMVRADLLDTIDYFLQINRENPLPFGGVQMLFFGDLFQLPPVIANQFERKMLVEKYDSPYFFSSQVMQDFDNFEFYELHHVYRQEELRFLKILNRIRDRTFDREDLEDLNQRYEPEEVIEGDYITISTTNRIVDSINEIKLNEIDAPLYKYDAKIVGNFKINSSQAPVLLTLKQGAQVMFLRNDHAGRYANGTIGKVISLDHDTIRVSIHKTFSEPIIIEVQKEVWEMNKYTYDRNSHNITSEVIGSLEQYPLKLAWAITIHKSQGLTFDHVKIDVGKGAFEHGQTYVALSRCRTLDGIILERPIQPKDILVDDKVTEFYERYL